MKEIRIPIKTKTGVWVSKDFLECKEIPEWRKFDMILSTAKCGEHCWLSCKGILAEKGIVLINNIEVIE